MAGHSFLVLRKLTDHFPDASHYLFSSNPHNPLVGKQIKACMTSCHGDVMQRSVGAECTKIVIIVLTSQSLSRWILDRLTWNLVFETFISSSNLHWVESARKCREVSKTRNHSRPNITSISRILNRFGRILVFATLRGIPQSQISESRTGSVVQKESFWIFFATKLIEF